jgi:hypothetical protein
MMQRTGGATMTDKERLDKIHEIATRSVLSEKRMPSTVRQDLYLIVTLCSSSDEFLERNAKQYEAQP